MDSLIIAAGRALAVGDALEALNYIALRDDPPALALRGIAMAQLGDIERARLLLRRATSGFGPKEAVARARCMTAEAEIALVSRDLSVPLESLDLVRQILAQHGDRANAAHATYLLARFLLLVGRLDEAERLILELDPASLQPASRAALGLVAAGIAMRRLRSTAARTALAEAGRVARWAGIPSLAAEVDSVARQLASPMARLVARGEGRPLLLDDVEALFASPTLIVDACRRVVWRQGQVVSLATRPVLLSLARTLAEAAPGPARREVLLTEAFRARHADESHRARLRVEIGRLRKALRELAGISATAEGFRLVPRGVGDVAVLVPPADEEHANVLALLADGEAWSSSALALALGTSQRSVQRALEELLAGSRIQAVGKGRARRWMALPVPGFPTSLLLQAALPAG